MKRVYETDVLVIGGGSAGIMSALSASRFSKCLIVSKEPIGGGNTKISAGLFCTSDITVENSPESIFMDIMKGGDEINNPDLVKTLSNMAGEITLKMENHGAIFKRDDEGIVSKKVLMRLSGHSLARSIATLYKGISMTGSLKMALAEKVRNGKAGIIENSIAVKTVIENGACKGAIFFNIEKGEFFGVKSKATILATGGAGVLYYPHTDNVLSSTGDGFSLALRSGASLIDMEQTQFIPFAVSGGSFTGIFLGEPSFAGPKGVIIDNSGNIVMKDVWMLTRAELSRKVGELLYTDKVDKLFLDPRGNLETDEGRKVYENLKNAGLLDVLKDVYGKNAMMWKEPIMFAPTFHYQCGGVKVNRYGETEVKNLFACGEVQGGTHGANRLGSVSLTETIVFGWIAGEKAAKINNQIEWDPEKEISWLESRFSGEPSKDNGKIRTELQNTMWKLCGVVRERNGLKKCLEIIRDLRAEMKYGGLSSEMEWNDAVRESIELFFMLDTAEAIALSALMRDETRGCHYRKDFPEKRVEWEGKNVRTYMKNGFIKGEVLSWQS